MRSVKAWDPSPGQTGFSVLGLQDVRPILTPATTTLTYGSARPNLPSVFTSRVARSTSNLTLVPSRWFAVTDLRTRSARRRRSAQIDGFDDTRHESVPAASRLSRPFSSRSRSRRVTSLPDSAAIVSSWGSMTQSPLRVGPELLLEGPDARLEELVLAQQHDAQGVVEADDVLVEDGQLDALERVVLEVEREVEAVRAPDGVEGLALDGRRAELLVLGVALREEARHVGVRLALLEQADVRGAEAPRGDDEDLDLELLALLEDELADLAGVLRALVGLGLLRARLVLDAVGHGLLRRRLGDVLLEGRPLVLLRRQQAPAVVVELQDRRRRARRRVGGPAERRVRVHEVRLARRVERGLEVLRLEHDAVVVARVHEEVLAVLLGLVAGGDGAELRLLRRVEAAAAAPRRPDAAGPVALLRVLRAPRVPLLLRRVDARLRLGRGAPPGLEFLLLLGRDARGPERLELDARRFLAAHAPRVARVRVALALADRRGPRRLRRRVAAPRQRPPADGGEDVVAARVLLLLLLPGLGPAARRRAGRRPRREPFHGALLRRLRPAAVARARRRRRAHGRGRGHKSAANAAPSAQRTKTHGTLSFC